MFIYLVERSYFFCKKIKDQFCCICIVGCVLGTVMSCSNSAFAQSEGKNFDRFANWLIEDPVHMVTDIQGDDVLQAGFIGASIASISTADRMTHSFIYTRQGNVPVLDMANYAGDKYVALSASAGLFGTSLLTNNRKFQDAAFTSLQSLLMTKITIGASKFLFARARPYAREGTYDFDFATHGQTSFPSGHTATAFAMITPWVVYYPNVATYSLMAIPAATGIARVYKGKHWLSDVTAGAVIGFSMGYYLSRKHLKVGGNNLQVFPRVGREEVGLSLSLNF